MNRILLAALALACFASPTMAAGTRAFVPEAGSGAHSLSMAMAMIGGVVMLLVGLLILVRGFRARPILAAFVVACFAVLNVVAAQAAEAVVAAAPVTTVEIPYGSWIATYGATFATWAVTALAGIASAAIAKLWPIAASVLTQQRLQQAGTALAEYGINAIAGSTKDGKVTVNLGSAAVAAAVQRGIDVLPSRVMKSAGGPEGLAAVVFRSMPLEEGAGKANVLDPAVSKLKATGAIK